MKNMRNARMSVSMPAVAILLLANNCTVSYNTTAQMVDESCMYVQAEVTT